MKTNLVHLLLIRYQNRLGLSRLKDENRSERAHTRTTLLGYGMALFLLIAYFVYLPFEMRMSGRLHQLIPYTASLLFWMFALLSVLAGFSNIIKSRDSDFIFTLPLQPWQAKLTPLISQYILRVGLSVVILLVSQAVLYMLSPFPLVNIGVGLLFSLLIPIAAMILNMTIAFLVRLLMRFLKIKIYLIESILVYLIVSSPLIFSYVQSGLSHPKLGLIHISVLPISLLEPLNQESWVYVLVFTLLTLGLTALLIFFIVKKYKALLNLLNLRKPLANRCYSLKTKSRWSVLFHNEISRYLSSFTYVSNTILMPVLLIIVALMPMVKGLDFVSTIHLDSLHIVIEKATVYLVLFITCSSLTTTTSCSFSIEGKTIWLIKSLPVSIAELAVVKLALNLLLMLPGLLLAIVGMVSRFHVAGWQLIQVILFLMVNTCFISCVGLYLNLQHPNYHWENEMEAVKQGLSTIVAAFISMIVIGVSATLLIFTGFAYFFMLILTELGLMIYIMIIICRQKNL